MTDLVDDITAFGAHLREEGLRVEPARLIAFGNACRLTSMLDAYWAGRATLVCRREDVPAYDRAFVAHFGRAADATADELQGPVPARPEVGLEAAASPRDDDTERSVAAASEIELLREKRFEDCTDEELRRIVELVARIAWALPLRRTRRRRPSRRGRPDVARTLRRTLHSQGEDWTVHHHRRSHRRRRLLLVLDVSGSMAASSRALLTFAHGALAADAQWEAFCFGTRLTRLTPALRARGPEAALLETSAAVADWHGGTRIGASLKALLDGWGQSRTVRGAVVVICSDGLEVGDVKLLGAQMGRLARTAKTVVWLNPLKGLPNYEPLARGMRSALPHLDVFASGDTLASLEIVATSLANRLRPA